MKISLFLIFYKSRQNKYVLANEYLTNLVMNILVFLYMFIYTLYLYYRFG